MRGVSSPDRIEDILQAGADKARKRAMPLMEQVREAVGLRRAAAINPGSGAVVKKAAAARFVSFRDDGGAFRFRLLDSGGQELFLSEPFKDPKSAGAIIRTMKQGVEPNWIANDGTTVALHIDGQLVCQFPADKLDAVQAAVGST